eukprot:g59622.t1
MSFPLRGRTWIRLSPMRIRSSMAIPVTITVKEANKAPRFVESRLKDIQKHLNLGAVKLVRKQDVPKGTRIIGVRLADFDRFQGEECIEQKSRVAAKGFQQRKGIDCGDVVIPTPDELAIRTIFALATLQRMRDTPVYLRMPVEYIPKDHYFEAWAGVNGLRDSGHLYHTRCVLPFYESVGLKANLYDECLFIGVDPKTKKTVLAVTHVDDYALAAPSVDYSDWFWGRLRERQGTIKVSKPIKVLLGREVWQYVDDDGVFHTHVTVREYIMDLIRKYPRTDGKQWTPVSVPWLESNGSPRRSTEFERYSPMKICGDLGWTRCVLWEIVAPLSKLAELQSKPAEFDYAGAEQLFRYIIGQAEQGLHYTSNGNRNLLCWSDSSFAMESERRSRSGGMVLLANGVIDSDSCKLRQVATSTNEAESRGLFRCMQRVIGIANYSNKFR